MTHSKFKNQGKKEPSPLAHVQGRTFKRFFTKQKNQIIHLIYIYEKINIINHNAIPFDRNGMGAVR